MDLATVALIVSIANGLAALTFKLIRLNERRRGRRRTSAPIDARVPGGYIQVRRATLRAAYSVSGFALHGRFATRDDERQPTATPS
jgi:hypothetical protein